MWSPRPEHPLRRLFSGLTEQTFMHTFGVADPRLTDYLSELLSRFIHVDALYRLRPALSRDHFIDYCAQGKRSYYIASTFRDDPYRDEAPVLQRLSEEFELCAYGLNRVRREWERQPLEGGPPLLD